MGINSYAQISVGIEGFKAYNVQGKTDGGILMPAISAYYAPQIPGHPWYMEAKVGFPNVTIGSDIYKNVFSFSDLYLGVGLGGIYEVENANFIWTMNFAWLRETRSPYYGLVFRLDAPMQFGNFGLGVGFGVTRFPQNRSGHLLGTAQAYYRL